MDKFVIVDGNSLINRAFYAIPILSNAKGFISNAVFGFCNMMNKLLAEESPEYAAVAFDKSRHVFRHERYPEYKGTRKHMPEELVPQFPVIKDILNAMGIAMFEMEGYEADDLMGTLASQAEKRGFQTLIVTGDRDAFQLIGDHTQVLYTKKGISETERYDAQALMNRYGLTPVQFIDMKGLMGDSSDNIPGIPGVGEKTALKLLAEHQTLENVIEARGAYKGKKLGGLLEDYQDQARMSRELATICREVPLEGSVEQCKIRPEDTERLAALFAELEFKGLLDQAVARGGKAQGQTGAQTDAEAETPGRAAEDWTELVQYLQGLNGGLTPLVLDMDPDGERVTLKAQDQEALTFPGLVPDSVWLPILKPYLEDAEIPKTVLDGKRDLLLLSGYGIALSGIRYDLLLMAYLLNPSRPGEDLASLARAWLTPRQWARETRSEGDAGAFDAVGRMEALAAELDARIRQTEMEDLYAGVELALEDCLVSMEQQGMHLNRQILEDIGAQLDVRLKEESQRIYELAHEEFNIGSPKQLGVVLFEKLGLPKGKKTKTGYSTDADILETLAPDYEIAGRILNWRQYFKLKTTYVEGLLGMLDSRTGKVHTSFNQRVTATGRLSSTEPNLQNIPVRMEEGRRIRRAFEAGPGNVLLAADYSQIELRVLAHMAGDPVLTDAFRNDQDIHARTAAEVFGIPMDQVTSELRRAAKAVNFGIVYGISDFGLAQNLGITRKEAGDYIEQYFLRYQGVRQYQERVLEEARGSGFVKTLMNRRRYLPDIRSRNYHLRSFTERAAINTPIQGTAADIIKLAMVRVFELLKGEGLSHTLVLQVHDELIFDMPRDCLDSWRKRIQDCMEAVMDLDVPLKVDLKQGDNWYDMRNMFA